MNLLAAIACAVATIGQPAPILPDPNAPPEALGVSIRAEVKSLTGGKLRKVPVASGERIVLGRMVYLTAEETGDVRERVWWIEPTVADFEPSADAKTAVFTSPSPGTYKVFVVSVGRQLGVVRAEAEIELEFHRPVGDPPAAAAPAASAAAKAETVGPVQRVRDALATVKSANKDVERRHLATVLRASRSLPEARANAMQSFGAVGKDWAEFFKLVEELFADFDRAGQTPTAAHVKGALNSVAKVIEQ